MKHLQDKTSVDNVSDIESVPICHHKPGDVWADGCCTSQKKAQATQINSSESGAASNIRVPKLASQ